MWELSVCEINIQSMSNILTFPFLYTNRNFCAVENDDTYTKRACLSEKFCNVFTVGDDTCYVSSGCVLYIREWQLLTRCHENNFWKIFQALPLNILNLFTIRCSSSSTRKQYFTLYLKYMVIAVILYSVILFLLLFLL